MWNSRIFWQLFGAYGCLLLLAVGILGVVLIKRAEVQYVRLIEHSLHTRALLVCELVRDRSNSEIELLQPRLQALRSASPTRITLITEDGTVLADSEADPKASPLANHADRPEIQSARQGEIGILRQRHSETTDQDMLYLALRNDDRRGVIAFVRVAVSLENVQRELNELQRMVWTTVAIAGLVGLVIAFWLARRLAQPLRDITYAAERIAAGEYGNKVFAFGQNEVGNLARSFNYMSTRLAEQFTQIEEDRQQLRTILSGMVEGVVALDADQCILFANERAGQLLGFQPETAVGRRVWEVVRQRTLQECVTRALGSDVPVKEELALSQNQTRSVTLHAARLSGGPARGIVLVLHDTSELRRLERLRQEFVANVSHELKTPLAVIKASVETLIDGAIEDIEHRGSFLDKIAHQAEYLHALILDLLSLARIEAGEEIYEMSEVPLEPLVSDCIERHRDRAEAKRQTLEAAGNAAGGDVAALADEEAMHEILNNLVDNAVKYTPEGGRILVRWWGENGHACLEVEDNGIGIPPQDLPRIFERFYRVDKARSREVGGTGLGLSIVKHLVQDMRGQIRAVSRPGQGTTFTVRLPRAPSD